MPKQSERQRFLQDVVDVLATALEEGDDDLLDDGPSEDGREDGNESNLHFSQVEDAFELLQLVQSARYLAERVRLPQSTYFDADSFLSSTTDSVFRQSTTIDKDSFASIVDETQDDPVFHSESIYAQAPVWMQLAVALDRFGNNGTGASLGRSQRLWGVGKGTVDNYTDRVVQALVDLSP
ncbi:hypothetical protein PHYPSEUDO_000889, partial [Phytophthora pseudosyringae]